MGQFSRKNGSVYVRQRIAHTQEEGLHYDQLLNNPPTQNLPARRTSEHLPDSSNITKIKVKRRLYSIQLNQAPTFFYKA
jgi:hypothetical protein